MFKLKTLNKKGFSHVEIIIFAVVVLAVGGIGYYTLSNSGASPKPPTSNRQVGTVEPTDAEIDQAVDADATPLKAKQLRKAMIKVAQAESKKNVSETKPGQNVPIPKDIEKYMTYVKSNQAKGNMKCVGYAKDPNRNNQYYPKSWGASFVSWVYNQASGGKTNFSACNGAVLYAYAEKHGAAFKIDAKHQPKLGDLVFQYKTGKPAIFISNKHGWQPFKGDVPYKHHTVGDTWKDSDGYKKCISNPVHNVIYEANVPESVETYVNFNWKFNNKMNCWDVSNNVGIAKNINYKNQDKVTIGTYSINHYKYYVDIAKVYELNDPIQADTTDPAE